MVDLDELERLERQATDGPWCEHPNGTSVWTGTSYADADSRHIFNAMHSLTPERTVANVHFICAARNDMPEIIAELRALRATAQQFEDYKRWMQEAVDGVCAALKGEAGGAGEPVATGED